MLSRNSTKQSTNLKKAGRFKSHTSMRGPYFLPQAFNHHRERAKIDQNLSEQRAKKHLQELFGKKGMSVGLTAEFPVDANRLSSHISIHASLKEIVFKLTFRWKWHWRTSRVRVHGGEGRGKKTHSSKSFSTPKAEHTSNPALIRDH